MSQLNKLIAKILLDLSDNNIKFSELVNLLVSLGFDMRISGSHHIFRKPGVLTKINLQKDGDQAKPYQVKQVRKMIIEYKLGDKIDVQL